MIQCKDCEFFQRGPNGEISFKCDPFTNVKESDCLLKWQLIKINHMVASYQATLESYRKFAPLQEKVMKVMEREIDEMDESEKWKVDEEGEDEENETKDWD